MNNQINGTPRYLDFMIMGQFIYVMQIINRIQAHTSIYFELEIQIQQFIKIFKSNVMVDTRAIELGTKIHKIKEQCR